MNLVQIFKQFPEQEDCIKYLELKRWKGNIICPYCNSDKTCPHKTTGRQNLQCWNCNKSFSVTVGTIFHNTHLELQKWFLAISLIVNAKKGISTRQLARDLELPVKTAYSLGMRIRKAMKEKNNDLFAGIVQMDETYIKTDKERKDKDDDEPKGGKRSLNNTPIVALSENGGKINAFAVKNIQSVTLLELAINNIKEGATIHADASKAYDCFKYLFSRESVKHNLEYVSPKGVHVNNVENFWSLLKRGIQGQFHHLSRKYLQGYIDEFTFRLNYRANGFKVLVERCLGV